MRQRLFVPLQLRQHAAEPQAGFDERRFDASAFRSSDSARR